MLDRLGPVQERLTTQPVGDLAGFGNGSRSGLIKVTSA